MSSPLITVETGVIVRDAALLMTEKKIGSISVTDAGKPVGIVTERDALARVVSLCRDPCETRISEIMSSPHNNPEGDGDPSRDEGGRDQEARRHR